MGAISIDPAELDSAGKGMKRSAAEFASNESRLSLGRVSGPDATAATLPEFEARWTMWIGELHAVVDGFAGGLIAAARAYVRREGEMAGWAEL